MKIRWCSVVPPLVAFSHTLLSYSLACGLLLPPSSHLSRSLSLSALAASDPFHSRGFNNLTWLARKSTPNPETGGHSTATNHVTALSQGKCSREGTKNTLRTSNRCKIPSVFTQLQAPAKLTEWQQNRVKSSRASGWPSAHPFSLFPLIKGCSIRGKQRHFQKEITLSIILFWLWASIMTELQKEIRDAEVTCHYQIDKDGSKRQLKPLGRWQIHCDVRRELYYWLNDPLEISHGLVW